VAAGDYTWDVQATLSGSGNIVTLARGKMIILTSYAGA
jgi:hypothetical protein